jgi:hypothetical protein
MRKLTDCNTGHSPNQRDEQRLAITQRQIMPVGIFAPYKSISDPAPASAHLRRSLPHRQRRRVPFWEFQRWLNSSAKALAPCHILPEVLEVPKKRVREDVLLGTVAKQEHLDFAAPLHSRRTQRRREDQRLNRRSISGACRRMRSHPLKAFDEDPVHRCGVRGRILQ